MILREDVQLKFYVMKKLFVLIVLMAGIVWGAEAQMQGDYFRTDERMEESFEKG